MNEKLKDYIDDEMEKIKVEYGTDYKLDKNWGRLDVDEIEKLKLDEDEVFFRGVYTAYLAILRQV